MSQSLIQVGGKADGAADGAADAAPSPARCARGRRDKHTPVPDPSSRKLPYPNHPTRQNAARARGSRR